MGSLITWMKPTFFDLDNHNSLSFKGCEKVNCADAVSGGDGFTLVLRMTGGINAKLHAPFLFLKTRIETTR